MATQRNAVGQRLITRISEGLKVSGAEGGEVDIQQEGVEGCVVHDHDIGIT